MTDQELAKIERAILNEALSIFGNYGSMSRACAETVARDHAAKYMKAIRYAVPTQERQLKLV